MTNIPCILWMLLFSNVLFAQHPSQEDFQQQVVIRVVHYNQTIDSLMGVRKAAALLDTGDTTSLDSAIQDVIDQCYRLPQAFVMEFPASPFCIAALHMLGDGTWKASPVKLADLRRLFDQLSPEVRGSASGQDYNKRLDHYEWLHTLKSVDSDAVGISPRALKAQLGQSEATRVQVKAPSPMGSRPDEQPLLEGVRAATVIVNMVYRRNATGKTEVNAASGYVIDERGICVTNYHVAAEYASNPWYTAMSIVTEPGKSYPVTKLLACSETDDLAILEVDTGGERLAVLPLGNDPALGTPVYVSGHPIKQLSDGGMIQDFYTVVSGETTGMRQEQLAGEPCTEMLISASFAKGSSGGPVVDSHGNVVGTVSRLSPVGERLVVPVGELRKLIETKELKEQSI